ncbi:hypothetical protein D9599_14340 [Roseomonas sp. KE2513]|uniref:alginate lyase family protein n=1 Tax=Roseomonas sp. KE2513 TaxID=2479202 RepID=UPI0018E038E7|nr:alginate lyase family protein [Roseomonas sp. KE2513]MBI0536753.1 hypothetical protein [Roseomonas sp. KE2513]
MTFRRAALILACLLAGPALAQAPRPSGTSAGPSARQQPAAAAGKQPTAKGTAAPNRPAATATRGAVPPRSASASRPAAPRGGTAASRTRPPGAAASRPGLAAPRPPVRPTPAAVPAAPVVIPAPEAAAVPQGAAPLLPAAAAALSAVPVARRGAPVLAGPFLPAPEPSGPTASCEPPGAPVRNLESTGFYADPAFSRPDPLRMRADAEAGRPLVEWLTLVQRAVARHRAGEAGAADCALAALDQWAKGGALLGAFNLQGGYHRKWALAGAALSFLAIREAPGLDPVALGRTARWLGEVAEAVRPHYERNSTAIISDVRNNHAAWAGLAVAAAGIAGGNRVQLDWGVARLRAQLAQVDERGVLPQEAKRGAMALHYHLFALDAVAALERLAAANGIALTGGERSAYARLRDLCLAAARDPARMEAIAGVPQSDPWLGERAPLATADGLEIASIATPTPELDEALASFRPYAARWLGGAITGWWKG